MRDVYVWFLNAIPLLDLVGTISGYFAQFQKLKVTKCSKDISITKQIIHWIVLFLWILYGVEYCTVSYVVTCVISIALCSLEILLTLHYRK